MAVEQTATLEVEIPVGGVVLGGSLKFPPLAQGLVVFVHGSGSSRFSPRNQYVARVLNQGHLATLLFDLLTLSEGQVDEITRHLRFDIPLLARRTIGAADWLAAQPDAQGLKLGFFGSSTGAAAALIAAADRPALTGAVVSRGGRPDLANDALARVQAPTLLLVGAFDPVVIELNQQAMDEMPPQTEKRLEVIPGATHLFEEAGTLERVAASARDWFQQHLSTQDEAG